jgi:hypothetical protein
MMGKCYSGGSGGMTKKDNINHPKHYTAHPSGIECIEVTRHMNYNLGTSIAYIWRSGLKDNAIEDLEKAKWHLSDEINRLKNLAKNEDKTS